MYRTAVDTSCPELWENNPWALRADEIDPGARVLECGYPLIHQSGRAAKHFIHGFLDDLSQQLGKPVPLTEFRGDIHLSPRENAAPSPFAEKTGVDAPYWLIVAGGKYDYTVKWWSRSRYQQIVDRFRGRIAFVQVGAANHHHPRLEGALDLRGATSLRSLLQWTRHAIGILCPVTFLMHLSAAAPPPPGGGRPKSRACVVVAGGREPAEWEAYPGHQFLHRVGALPCCDGRACWKSRALPLGDGDAKDAPEHLCLDVVDGMPRCMDLISVDDVARAIELCYADPRRAWLTPAQSAALSACFTPSRRASFGIEQTPPVSRDVERNESPVPA